MPQTKERVMETHTHAFKVRRHLNRRGFLRATAIGVTGLAGVMAQGQPPAVARERELTMLSFNNFVPSSDEKSYAGRPPSSVSNIG
jgi:hypothetical protein